jgi:hypothetical protein
MRLATVCVGVVAIAMGCTQGPDAERQHSWVDSFESYKSNIRPFDMSAQQSCESQLHRILSGIDAGGACTVDADCTLIDQEPFGPGVPVRVESAEALVADMTEFRSSCDDGSLRFERNDELVSVPACVKNRCMVMTSSR